MKHMKKNKLNSLSPMGLIIKVRLIEMGMKQRELAEKIGANQKYLNLVLYGQRSGKKYIEKIENVLGINIEKFKQSA